MTDSTVRTDGPSQIPALTCQNQNSPQLGLFLQLWEAWRAFRSQKSNREPEMLITQHCPFKGREGYPPRRLGVVMVDNLVTFVLPVWPRLHWILSQK